MSLAKAKSLDDIRINHEASEKASRMVSKVLKEITGNGDFVDGKSLKWAKSFVNKICDEIIMEMKMHHQKDVNCIQRQFFWELVKQKIKTI